jgi:hypothetical protein
VQIAHPEIDFFVSYTVADEPWAEWISHQLQEANYRVLVQAWDFRPGNNFVLAMHKGSYARHTLAVISPRYLEREFPSLEWAAALRQDPEGGARKLIPVKIEECNIEGLLGPIVYIDLVGKSAEEARRELLNGVAPGRTPIAGPPEFPPELSTDIDPPVVGRVSNVTDFEELRDRKDEFAEIWSRLRDGSSHNPAVIVLAGESGSGKSSLARYCASSIANERKIVWELPGEDVLAVTEGLASLAQRLELVEPGRDPNIAAQAAHRWLAANDEWLLLVDGAGPSPHVRTVLPATGQGHVLITTTDTSWDDGEAVSVGPLPLTDAVQWLLEAADSNDQEGATELARALGCSPLLIELAIPHCREVPNDLFSVAERMQGAG